MIESPCRGGQTWQLITRIKPRSRRVSLKIISADKVVLVRPVFLAQEVLNEFLTKNQLWICQQLAKWQKKKRIIVKQEEYLSQKKEFADLLCGRVIFFGSKINLLPKKIKVNFGRTRWGSCSAKKTLNFNFRLSKLPKELIDYVVIHEICHLAEFNHSKKFWLLVKSFLPDYQAKRRLLKEYY